MNAKLNAKVRAVNRANEEAIKLYKQLAEIFRPLVGSTILKKDGTLFKNVSKLIPSLPYNWQVQVTRHSSNYSLVWGVNACESIDEHSCIYHEAMVYVGHLTDGVLTDLSPPYTGRTNWTAGEVETGREKHRKAKLEVDDALAAIWPFGEYDR